MRVEIITVRFDSVMESFDDTALKEFIVDKEVISVREHFFTRNGTPVYRPGGDLMSLT